MGKIDVVVTGIGLVTPSGDTIESFWDAVSQRTCPRGLSSLFCSDNIGTREGLDLPPRGKSAGGGVSDFSIKKQYSGCDRFIHFALDAADSAVRDAALSKNMLKEAGITISSSKGGIGYIGGPASNRDIYSPSPCVQGLGPHMAASICAEWFGCCGPCLCVISACATGLSSIIIGANLIKTGRAKIVLSGGTDACLTEFMISAYSRLGVLASDYCRPYDKRRTGFKLSEGAAVVVLEEKNSALNRNVKIYGEITGQASLNEGYHITSINPDAETISEAIKLASQDVSSIDYINTHGTGTVENDIIETQALKKALGRNAYSIPMSSTKSAVGHMLGASGAVEFIVGLLAIKEGFVPPTMNLSCPDPRCDLDYTPILGKRRELKNFLTLSYGFGGHICAVEVKKV